MKRCRASTALVGVLGCLFALLGAAPARAEPVTVTQVMVWGDSMTQRWPRYLQDLLGIPVIANGVGGDTVQDTQVRFDAWVDATPPEVVAATGHLCWCGHPNANRRNSTASTIVPVLQQMAARVPDGLFRPIGLTNGPDQPMGSTGYDSVVVGVNGDMAAVFGANYLEIRGYLVSDGLAVAGLTATSQDLLDIADDVPPSSLRVAPGGGNPAHLNDAGRRVTAARLDDLIRTAGWVGPEPVAVGVSDAEVVEGNDGTVDATFTVSLSAEADADVTVGYATADGTAVAVTDYAAANGTVLIPAGTTSAEVVVEVWGDVTPESDESFQLVLSAPVGAEVGDGLGLGTIVNDDDTAALPTVTSVSPDTVGQSAAGRVLTVTGTGFTDSSLVTFSGADVGATGFSYVDENTLVITVASAVAARLGSRDVVVTNLGVGSGTCAACVTVTPRPRPETTNPSTLPRNTLATVVLTGTAFQPDARAAITGRPGVAVLSTTYVSPTELSLLVQIGRNTAAGPATVRVQNGDGGIGSCVGCFGVTTS